MVVFTRGNQGGSAQHATRATPTRSSHRPMGAQPYDGGIGGGCLYLIPDMTYTFQGKDESFIKVKGPNADEFAWPRPRLLA